MVADELARAIGAKPASGKFDAELAEGAVDGEKVVVLWPQTFMNRSGESVGPALRFWKLALSDLVVVHDDLELDAYRVQIKVGGGHSGHNGLKSLNAHLSGADYPRVRVGVGRPPPMMDPADYVLGRFEKADEALLAECVNTATAAVKEILTLGTAKAMNQFNRRK
jgi:PTH1 family peptidyl-tRNA hydrolase